MNGRQLALLGVAWIAGAACPAWGQGAKGGNHFGLPIAPMSYLSELRVSADAAEIDDTIFREMPQGETEATYTATDSATVSAGVGEESATAEASYSASFSLDLKTSVLTGTFTAEGMSEAIDADEVVGRPDASHCARFDLSFSVESESATVQIFGNGSASGFGGPAIGEVAVELLSAEPFQLFILAEGGTQSQPINETLEVGPGTYRLRLSIDGEAFFNSEDGPGTATSTSSISINVMITPNDTAQTITWNSGADGSFDDETNWDPETVPSNNDIAVFGNGGLYDVSFGDEASRRAIVRDSLVRWVGGSYNLSGGSEVDPSLVVGPNSTTATTLGIDGTQVNSIFASIGEAVGSDALVSVVNGAALNNSARLVVGESGMGSLDNGADGSGRILTGELRIGENAQAVGRVEIHGGLQKQVNKLQAGATAVGFFGEGALIIDDAEVQTGQASIGALFNSVGEVTVEGDLGIAQWVFGGELRVGDQGLGALSISGGSVMSAAIDRVVVGFAEGSNGSISVNGTTSSLTTFSEIAVGTTGMGSLSVNDGGFVEGSALLIGPSEGPGGGTVTVTGVGDGSKGIQPSRIMVSDDLSVGAGGQGRLELNGGQVFAVEAFIAEFETGNAFVRLFNGGVLEMSGAVTIGDRFDGLGTGVVSIERQGLIPSFLIGDTVTLHTGSSVIGNGGILRTTNGFTNMGGTIIGVVVDAAKQNGDNGLTIEGDFAMNGGTIEVEAAGLDEDLVGRVHVTGDAAITDATVTFVFVEGFLPQTADEIPFLLVDGDLTAQDLTLAYEGAAPGFEYEVKMENGMLVFTALNDAQTLASGGRCASGGTTAGEFGADWALAAAVLLAGLWRRHEKLSPGRLRSNLTTQATGRRDPLTKNDTKGR